jgi:hypothetical protein
MNSWENLGMAGAINRVDLHPFSAPQRLALPDGFKTAAVSVDFGGNAIRLLVKEGSAGGLMQRTNRLEENTPRFLLLREIRGRVKRH